MPGLPPGRIPANNPRLPKVQEVTMLIKLIPAVFVLLVTLTIPVQIIGGSVGTEIMVRQGAEQPYVQLLGSFEAVNPE